MWSFQNLTTIRIKTDAKSLKKNEDQCYLSIIYVWFFLFFIFYFIVKMNKSVYIA